MTSTRPMIVLALSLALVPAADAAPRKRDSQSAPASTPASGGEEAEHARLQKEIDFDRALLRKLLQQQKDQADAMLKLLQQRDKGGGRELASPPPTPPARTEPPEPVARESARTPEPMGETEPREASPRRFRSGSGVLTGKVSLQGGGNLAEAVVFVTDVRGRAPKNNVLTIRQVNKQFVPRMAVVPRGTKLEIPNEDNIFHNAFSLSPGNSFDLGTYRAGDQPGAVALNTPGVVKIFCNIHSQMTASILVVPGTLFAQVKPDGTFRLSGVPAGRHQLAAWLPNAEVVLREVEVAPGDNEGLAFSLNTKPDPAHTNKFGQPYGSYAE